MIAQTSIAGQNTLSSSTPSQNQSPPPASTPGETSARPAPPKELQQAPATDQVKQDTMAEQVSFSAVRNPANPDRAFIYRIARVGNSLSYEQRSFRNGTSAPRGNKNPTDENGVRSTVLRGNSNLVAFYFDDMINVFGVSEKTNLVTLLSPFVEPLEPKIEAKEGKLAGCAFKEHDQEQARLVYQSVESDAANAKATLMICDITTPETPDAVSTAKDIQRATSISVFHDTRRMWIIFQNTQGQLVAHNETDQKPSIISPDKSHFRSLTPIGSCFIPAKQIDPACVPGFKSGALGRAIVYWVRIFNDKPRLYRSHADIMENSSGADFSEPRQATEIGVAVEPLAQISVVTNPATQSNYLFVAKQGGDNISTVTDDWAAQNESLNGLDTINTELFKRWQSKILEEAILGNRYGNGNSGFPGKPHTHHHHGHNGYTNGYANGFGLLEEGSMEEETADEEVLRRVSNGTKNLPLVWRNKGDATKPQLHSGVITRTASSKWSEAEVQVVIPAGSTIMGDISVTLKVRPTD